MQTKSRNDKKKTQDTGKQKDNKKRKTTNEKKKHVKQNRLAYLIMGVGYLSEPGFGVLYFGGFF